MECRAHHSLIVFISNPRFSSLPHPQNNIIGTFLKLEQLLTTNDAYTKDDFTIAAIPSADQVALLINASALGEPSSTQSTTEKAKKVSVSSMGGSSSDQQHSDPAII